MAEALAAGAPLRLLAFVDPARAETSPLQEVDGGQRPPRAPRGGNLRGVANRGAARWGETLDGPAQTEVGTGERIGLADAQRHIVRCPGTEAWNGGDRRHQRVEADTAVEPYFVLGHGGGEGANCRRSCRRESEAVEVGVGQRRRWREECCQPPPPKTGDR